MTSIPQSGIYRITCVPTGKIYIGSSLNIRKRWQTHRSFLRNNQHSNAHLQNAWNKYGEQSFAFAVVELVLPRYVAEREQYWLDVLQPFNERGFNLSMSADVPNRGSHIGKGKLVSIETREKLRRANLGKRHSPETRAKMSKAQRGKKMHADSIAKTTAAVSGNWVVTSPDGQEMSIRNLTEFCRIHHLNRGNLVSVADGKRNHNHGWKCRRA